MKRLAQYITKTNDLNAVKESLNTIHEYDIAQLLLMLDSSNRKKIYAIYNDEELADIFAYLDEKDASLFLEEVSVAKKAAIINEMEPDDATDLLQESTENEQDQILNLVDEDMREDLMSLREYEEYSAGAEMTTHFISVLSGSDVKVAMKTLVSEAPDVESINTIFVVDDKEMLLGTIGLKELIITKSPCIIDTIMNPNYKFANTNTDIEEVIRLITDYDVYDLPILENGMIKGIITMDDAIDNLVDEASEDYARLAGLTTDQEKGETFTTTIKKRIPWLVVLLILDLFVPLISSLFDFVFTKTGLQIIIIFQPVILGLAGNSATQSLGIAIRSISNKSLDNKNGITKHLTKELSLGVLLGITLGLLSFVLTYAMLQLTKATTLNVFDVALTVGLSTMSALLISNFIGAVIPIIFYRIHIDPAVASGPFITTIIDVISVVLYFAFAIMFLYNI